MSRRSTKGPDGLVVVDKPAGHTSHDVVARLRGIARTRRVGHAGTLDPMATGVLVIGLGRATRLLGHLALTDKEYLGTIRLGQDTVTDDAEGEVIAGRGAGTVDRGAVEAAVVPLTGEIMQVPARVSAVKVDGKRAHRRVREGEEVELPPRPVTVSRFTVHEVVPATAEDGTPVLDVTVTVACSSGTYIRALARDLGAALGTGGHLTALRRTRVGPHRIEDAVGLEDLAERARAGSGDAGGTRGANGEPAPALVPMTLEDAAATAFPRWDLDARRTRLIANGVRLDAEELPGDLRAAGPVAAFGTDGRLVALVEAEGRHIRVRVGFPEA
ncbi:tRNA pseudouridine(55) synthase TruB [Streptomyces calidiresistens]|uniref:tRNA pseudouridine synthase B n=1 Tax=Streptomyces calidiresistens TaxID=1485586 RepID=A0A7W3T2Z0_9ACTN|nr:tRNA pseudouridine(55) synthase TruB [Streptomyces calidiresistens]MBB0229984.1 tRNA pseudouridine(55) synthase TruB [Streptomyces calidiresistens]